MPTPELAYGGKEVGGGGELEQMNVSEKVFLDFLSPGKHRRCAELYLMLLLFAVLLVLFLVEELVKLALVSNLSKEKSRAT